MPDPNNTNYCAYCGCWALEQFEGFCLACWDDFKTKAKEEKKMNPPCRHIEKPDGPRCGLAAEFNFEFGESDNAMLSADMCAHHATMQYFALTDEMRLEIGRRVFVPGMGAWMCVNPLVPASKPPAPSPESPGPSAPPQA